MSSASQLIPRNQTQFLHSKYLTEKVYSPKSSLNHDNFAGSHSRRYVEFYKYLPLTLRLSSLRQKLSNDDCSVH